MFQLFEKIKEQNLMAALSNSQLLMQNQFQFVHPYDMEPCKDIVQLDKHLNWTFTPNGDPEWIFMLNRQEYLLDLYLAYQVTSETVYLEKIKYFILDWIRKNPCVGDSLTWRTIDTGIRLTYWSLVLDELITKNILTIEEQVVIQNSVYDQVMYLDESYIEKYELSNWGVLIVTGSLLVGNYYPDCIDEDLNKRLLARLTNQLHLQISQMGLHWEQSPLYFMEVFRSFMFLYLSEGVSSTVTYNLLEEVVYNMYHALPHFVSPSGLTIMQGDTDLMCVTDAIQTAGVLLDEPIPMLFGEDILVDYAQLYWSKKQIDPVQWQHKVASQKTTNYPLSLHDNQTGNYFSRTSWDNQANYYHIYNGPLGSGHGHISLGHVDLTLTGQNILVDSGRYTYQETKERYALKEATAHNTILLNQTPYGKVVDSWAYKNIPTSLGNQVFEDENYHVTQIMYLDETTPHITKVVRTAILIKGMDTFILFDQIIPSSKELTSSKMTRLFHLDPAVQLVHLSKESAQLAVSKSLNSQKTSHFWVYFSEGNVTESKFLYSPLYNELSSGTLLLHVGQKREAYTVFSGRKDMQVSRPTIRKSDGKLVDSTKCSGITLSLQDKVYSFSSNVQDTFEGHKLYYMNDIPVYGKLCVVEETTKTYLRIF